MSSFEEYRKKMASKYGTTPKEEDEKQKEKKATVDGSSVWDDSFESTRRKLNSKYSADIDLEGVKSWFDEGEKTFKSISEYYKANDGKWVSNFGNEFTDSITNLRNKADAVGYYLRNNKSEFSDYASVSKAYSEYLSFLNETGKQNASMRDFYSQFGSEDEYNEWYTNYKATQDILNSEDFEYYSQQGANIENPSVKEAEGFMTIGQFRLGGKDIGNIVTYSRDNDLELRLGAANGSEMLGDFRYSHMTDTEVGIYNYYLAKYGKDKAAEYLKSIDDDLTKMEAGQIAKRVSGDAFLEATFSIIAGLDQAAWEIGNIDNLLKGTEADPTTVTQYANGQIRGNIDGIGGVAYDLSQNIAHMLPSILVGSLTGGIGGAVTLGTSAASGAYAEMRNDGYNEWQARGYGLLVGASEAALQYALGGISPLGNAKGGMLNKVTEAALKNVDNALARFAINVGSNMFEEGFEEAAQSVLEPIFKGIFTGKGADIDWGEVAYSGLLGVLSAGTLEGVPTLAGTVDSNYKTNVQMGGLSNKGAVNAFFKGNENGTKGFKGVSEAYKAGKQNVNEAAGHYVNKAIEIDSDNAHAQRMQARLDKGKDVSGYQLNRIVEANENALVSQDKGKMKSAVEARLTELGETGDIGKLADVIVKAQSGETLTRSESKVLTESKYGRRVSTEMNPQMIESGEYTSKWAEKIGTERINAEAYSRGLYDLAEEVASVAPNAEEKHSVAENTPTKEIATEGKFEASEDGKTTYNGNEVKIARIAPSENGEVMVQLDNGEVVNARDVEFSSHEEALIYEATADMDIDTANDFVQGFISMKNAPLTTHQTALDYKVGFNEAATYGELGISYEALARDGKYANALVGNQAQIAYNRGKINGVNKAATAKKDAPGKAVNGQQKSPRKYKGETHVSEIKKSRVYKEMSDTQKAGIDGMTAMYKALGIDVYFFESPTDAKGKRLGKNGYFNPEDNSVHIDLYAGLDGRGTILFTSGHELTHYIRVNLPSKFKAFADLLFEKYEANDTSVASLIAKKKADLDKLGRLDGLTPEQALDLAYEETVADACEAMLADGKAFAELSEKVKAKDKGLWNAIKKFFTDLVAKIKGEYENLSPDSVAGSKLAEMLDTAEELRSMWVDMLVEASEIENAVAEVVEADAEPISTDEIITDGAVVTDGKGNKYSIRSMKHDISNGQMFRDLMTYCSFTKEQVGVLRGQLEDLVEYMNPYRDIVDLNETYGREGRRYSPYKPNSDPLYTISLDFSTQCSKRLLTQYVIEQLQLRENRPMSPEEQMAIRDMLKEYGKVEKGLQVACVMCYVEAARLKAPKQIQKWLDDPATAMRNFFADKNPEFSAYIKEKQADFKESKGYDRNATKKDMSAKDRTALNKIRPKLRAEYKPSAEEMAIIETASNLPNSTYLTAGNLADLSETHPDIYKAYTAFIRTATRSKALETDEPYYYGDSTRDNGNGIIVSDSFIEAVNRENGMRFSSWSDWLIQHLLDWITAVIDNSVRGAAMHGYTKYGDEVRVLGKTGMMFNMSGVAGTQTGLNEDGSLNFSETESMDYDEAIALREEFPDTAGLQCIGVGIDHIFELLRSDVIDYVIPYHTSGLNATLRRMGDIYGWKDFTQTQHATEDKSIKKENAVVPDHWHQEPVFSEFFVGYDTGLNGIEAMRKSAENYKRMCRERGLIPKFNEFAKEANYWKLLIDRKMVNQKTNTLIRQRAVTPDFDFGVIKGIVDKYVANYDSGLEQRAFNHIVENWDNIPKRIRDLKKQGSTKSTKKAKKSVDTLANQTVAVQPKGIKYSDRESYAPTFYSYMGKVIDDIKLDKMGAGGVVSYLKGKGVKNDEVKWSGIEAFLEGKKSVTKAELQEFVAGSQLQIQEELGEGGQSITLERSEYGDDSWDLMRGGEVLDTYSWNEDSELYESDATGGGFRTKESLLNYFKEKYGSGDTRWGEYKLDGGTNYRELVFKMPNSTYSNMAMQAHWGQDAEGVLAHSRIQDMTTSDGKKMLFVEEIQSDWHNAGAKYGYRQQDGKTERVLRKESEAAYKKFYETVEQMVYDNSDWETDDGPYYAHPVVVAEMFDGNEAHFDRFKFTNEQREVIRKMVAEEADRQEAIKTAPKDNSAPDAPFKNNYHEYVLKRLLRMAAEEGYDSLGWTPADIQSERWSDEYAEGYRIEYDQDIPKFLRKYGKKWGATVGTARTTEGYDVWSMDIPDSMKDSVLHEGQVMYSYREIQPITESEIKDLEKNFGTTGNFKVAGYLLTDGKLLDFSGKHWGDTTSRTRQVDHRDVQEVIGNRDSMNGTNAMIDMIGSGNIRLMPEDGGINLAVYPNEKQRKVLSLYINYMLATEGQVIIDYDAVGGDTVYSREYGKTATSRQILADIRNYFNGARQSDLMRFHTMNSDRDPNAVSNRSLLANALESVAKNDIERNKLKEYQGKIALIESEQAKLAETKAKIKELSFAKGRRDTEAIKKLQFEVNQTANRINTYDRQLLNLEATTALKGVLQREKQLAYKKAEKEGKEALARYREKSAETQRELLTRYQESRKKGVEGRKKTEMRYKIKNVVNELNQYLLNGTKEKHVPIELQKAVAEALDAVNMDTVGAEERIAKKREEMRVAAAKGNVDKVQKLAKEIDNIREMGGNLDAKLSRLKTAYDSIINSDDPLIANSHDAVISSSIDKVIEVVGDTPLRDMSLYQLEAVYDLYKMVLHSIRTANKAFKAAKGEAISTIANGVIAELAEGKQRSPYSTKTKEKLSEYLWNNQKPVYAFERIGSKNFTKVFNAVRAGEDVWAKDMSDAQAFREEQFKKYGYDSWDFKKRYAFMSTSGVSFELSLDQILSLYAFSKRVQAGDHLKYGGFVFDGLTEVKQKNKVGMTVTYQLKDATAYNLSEETLAEIIGKLTPEQKEFADTMQDYLSTVMGEKGNEVSLELYDIKLFKEKNYFPLKSAPQYLAKAKEQAQGEVKIKNSGFTKETSPKAKNPIVLSSFMDVWANHVNDMSMYHAFTLPLEDFYRVYNYHTPTGENMGTMSVGASLENAHGPAAVRYIDQLLKDINGGARSDPRESTGKALMSNFKKAAVMASLSVVVQQPTAIVRAMAVVDGKYFLGKPLKQKHKEAWAEVKKYAPVAVIKEMGYFDTGMGQGSAEWLKGEKTLMDKVDDVTSKLPALADEITWVAIWNAVKRETVHNYKHLAPNSDAFLKVVGERFTEVITKTQVYDSTLSRSANMRSKSTFMNMVTSFMAEPTTSINMLQDAFHKGNKKYIARTMGAVYGSVILNAALVSIVYAMRDDDEDETFMEKYLSRFTTEVLDGANPLTYLPFVKDIWSIAQGFDVERADMSLISDLIGSFQNLTKVIRKDTSDMDEDELKEHKKDVRESVLGIMDSFSSLTGVPVKNIRRDINGVINFFGTVGSGMETTAGSLGDNILEDVKDSVPVLGWLPDETKGDKLLDAIIKGDETYVERFKNSYKDEDSYHSAVKKVVRKRLEDGELTATEAERIIVSHGGVAEEDAPAKVQYWEFKMDYPDYEISEEAVTKYYSEVEPSGINIKDYYDYSKQRAKCKGTDANGDGKTDSGSVKREVLDVINSLPISSYQKDVLYYLNGWSASTIWEAPWH